MILASLGGAAIWRVANFHDPRWWANGWTYVGSLAGVTLLLILALSLTARARRALQLAAVLSLLLHLGIFFSLNQYRLRADDDDPLARRDLAEPVEEFRAPDYHIRAREDPAQDFEKPVETTLPAEQPEEIERRERPQEQDLPDDNRPTPLPGETPDVEANVLPLEKMEQAAPRLAPSASELSRAEPAEAEPTQPAPVPLPAQQLSPEPDAPAPATAETSPTELAADTPAITRQSDLLAAMDVSPSDAPATLPERAGDQSPAMPRPAVPAALSGRAADEPQIRAPQVADAPCAESGTDEPLDDPRPLVAAPIREGTGSQLPHDLGTLRGADQPVAVRPTVPEVRAATVPRSATARLTPRAPEANTSLSPAGATTSLGKSSTAEMPVPSARLPSLDGMATGDASSASRTAVRPTAPGSSFEPARQSTAASLPVRIAAPLDVGGLARNVTPELGTPHRAASEESRLVHPGPARLLARKSGGPLAIDGRSREPAEAFAHRGGLRKNPAGPRGQFAEQTEAAIERGLAFLAQHQRKDGSWSLRFTAADNVPDPPSTYRAETAATGLALLSFLGAGYDHYGGGYSEVVQQALEYLVEHQKADGDLYLAEDEQTNRNAWLYSHGIASIALCEAYGMTGDKKLAGPAQKAIDFIIASQDPRLGAWRYLPGVGSDTSVSGWQLMALKSGELAGLQVPAGAYERVNRWLDRAQVGGSRYVYNPGAADTPQQRHGRLPTASMTAVGLLMRLYTGLNRDDLHMVEGAEYLLGSLPETGTMRAPARDTYYWYYATQVMFHMRGKYWARGTGGCTRCWSTRRLLAGH